jgi:hypothetical protein
MNFKQYLSLSGQPVPLETPPPVGIHYQYTLSVSPEKADIEATGAIGYALLPCGGKGEGSPASSSQPLSSNNGYLILTLPDLPEGLAHAPYSRYNSRRSASLLLPYAADEAYHYTIRLADGLELAVPESEKTIDNAAGKAVISIRQDGRSVNVVRSIVLRKQLITPADYAGFRTLMIEWADPNNLRLLLKLN